MLSESNVESVANWKNAHSKSGRVAYACWRPEAPKSDGVTIKATATELKTLSTATKSTFLTWVIPCSCPAQARAHARRRNELWSSNFSGRFRSADAQIMAKYPIGIIQTPQFVALNLGPFIDNVVAHRPVRSRRNRIRRRGPVRVERHVHRCGQHLRLQMMGRFAGAMSRDVPVALREGCPVNGKSGQKRYECGELDFGRHGQLFFLDGVDTKVSVKC
jgi:hypothetical protein